MTTYRIPECNLAELETRIAKLARRSEKLGLVPPAVTVERTEDVRLARFLTVNGEMNLVEATDASDKSPMFIGWEGFRRYCHVALTGEAPTIPGWALVAVIEHGDTELGNVLRVAPGMECPPSYRKASALCEHCGTVRHRLETFVLLSPEGAHKQVGQNCLADFCRDPKKAAQLCGYAEIMESAIGFCSGAEDEGFFGFGGREVQRASVESVLAMTARIIRHCGWVSRTKARETEGIPATADIVNDVFFNRDFFKASKSDEMTRLQAAAKDVTEADVSAATTSLEWIRAMRPEAETLNDYLYNVLVVASEETVQRKHFGILCSLVASHQRHLGQLEERKRQGTSEHFGTESVRGRWLATVANVKAFDGDQWADVRYLVRFTVGGKDIGTWWTSTDKEITVGNACVLVGTVKRHSEYKGIKQTELSRCDLLPVVTCACGHPLIAKDKKCPACKAKVIKLETACKGEQP